MLQATSIMYSPPIRSLASVSFQLLREEREARMVDIFGIPFNLVIPDGGAGGEQGTGAREAQQVRREDLGQG